MNALPTREEVCAILRWDGEAFYWLPRPGAERFNARRAGTRAGWLAENGYRCIMVGRRLCREHRLAWLVHTGSWPAQEIDHINGDPADNRIENLRDVSHRVNGRNTRMRSDNKSGISGVHWHSGTAMWRVALKIDGKLHSIGRFKNKDDAAAARNAAAKRLGFTERHGVAA